MTRLLEDLAARALFALIVLGAMAAFVTMWLWPIMLAAVIAWMFS